MKMGSTFFVSFCVVILHAEKRMGCHLQQMAAHLFPARVCLNYDFAFGCEVFGMRGIAGAFRPPLGIESNTEAL
jgi:hypothetical protein